MKILVCCHKKDIVASEPPYFPIHVGKALSQVDLGVTGDDSGDNISLKNGSYCELTGVWWAWKNLPATDYIGLCHYRRYFDFHHQCPNGLPQKVFPTAVFPRINLTVPEAVVNDLKEGCVYVANPVYYPHSLRQRWCKRHHESDFSIMERIVKNGQPENVVRAFYDVMIRGNKLHPCNMFLMKWADFDAYCSWLFPLLGEMERTVSISNYDAYQRRIFGFMAERLLNVWLVANGKQVVSKPLIMLSDDASAAKEYSPLRFLLGNKLRCLANNLTRKETYKEWLLSSSPSSSTGE